MGNKLLAIAQLTAFITMLSANALANILPINNYTTGQVSALFNNYFVPAGFTFSIWSVIYLLLLAYVVYGTVQLFKNKQTDILIPLANMFVISCTLNCIWIFLWHHLQIGLCLVVMQFLFAVLLQIYLFTAKATKGLTIKKKIYLHIPFVMYIAWICVATIANTAAFLTNIHWSGWGIAPTVWSCILIIVAGLLATFMGYFKKEPLFIAVICWALYGIMQKQMAIAIIAQTAKYVILFLALVLVISVIIKTNNRNGIPKNS